MKFLRLGVSTDPRPLIILLKAATDKAERKLLQLLQKKIFKVPD